MGQGPSRAGLTTSSHSQLILNQPNSVSCFMAQETWNVKLIDKGRTMTVQVQATGQAEARRIAEHQYPGYKAMTAQRA